MLALLICAVASVALGPPVAVSAVYYDACSWEGCGLNATMVTVNYAGYNGGESTADDSDVQTYLRRFAAFEAATGQKIVMNLAHFDPYLRYAFPQLLTSNVGPDLIILQSVTQGGDNIMPLTALAVANDWVGRYPASLVNRTIVNGEIMGLIDRLGGWFVWFEKSVFARLGLVPPDTWEEMMAICDVFAANGMACFPRAGTQNWETMLWADQIGLRLGGLEWFDRFKSGQMDLLTDATYQEVWALLAQVRSYLPQPLNSTDTIGYVDELVQWAAGGWTGLIFSTTTILQAAPYVGKSSTDFAWFPFPKITAATSALATNPTQKLEQVTYGVWCMSAMSKNPVNAQALLQTFSSYEYAADFVNVITGFVPGLIEAQSLVTDANMIAMTEYLSGTDIVIVDFLDVTLPTFALVCKNATTLFWAGQIEQADAIVMVDNGRKEILLQTAVEPSIAPPEGNYPDGVTVTLTTATANATIMYALADINDDFAGGNEFVAYTAPILLSAGLDLRVVAYTVKDFLISSVSVGSSYYLAAPSPLVLGAELTWSFDGNAGFAISFVLAFLFGWLLLPTSDNAVRDRLRMANKWVLGGGTGYGIGCWALHLLGASSIDVELAVAEGVNMGYDLALALPAVFALAFFSILGVRVAAGAWEAAIKRSAANGGTFSVMGDHESELTSASTSEPTLSQNAKSRHLDNSRSSETLRSADVSASGVGFTCSGCSGCSEAARTCWLWRSWQARLGVAALIMQLGQTVSCYLVVGSQTMAAQHTVRAWVFVLALAGSWPLMWLAFLSWPERRHVPLFARVVMFSSLSAGAVLTALYVSLLASVWTCTGDTLIAAKTGAGADPTSLGASVVLDIGFGGAAGYALPCLFVYPFAMTVTIAGAKRAMRMLHQEIEKITRRFVKLDSLRESWDIMNSMNMIADDDDIMAQFNMPNVQRYVRPVTFTDKDPTPSLEHIMLNPFLYRMCLRRATRSSQDDSLLFLKAVESLKLEPEPSPEPEATQSREKEAKESKRKRKTKTGTSGAESRESKVSGRGDDDDRSRRAPVDPRVAMARAIVVRFVLQGAPREVNVDSGRRTALASKLTEYEKLDRESAGEGLSSTQFGELLKAFEGIQGEIRQLLVRNTIDPWRKANFEEFAMSCRIARAGQYWASHAASKTAGHGFGDRATDDGATVDEVKNPDAVQVLVVCDGGAPGLGRPHATTQGAFKTAGSSNSLASSAIANINAPTAGSLSPVARPTPTAAVVVATPKSVIKAAHRSSTSPPASPTFVNMNPQTTFASSAATSSVANSILAVATSTPKNLVKTAHQYSPSPTRAWPQDSSV